MKTLGSAYCHVCLSLDYFAVMDKHAPAIPFGDEFTRATATGRFSLYSLV